MSRCFTGFFHACLSVALAAGFVSTTHAQGGLSPTGTPTAVMRSLDEVYDAARDPRTPIFATDLPLVIDNPGSYYFAENITFTDTNNNAITINANEVTIDLNGFILTGPGKDAPGGTDGIRANASGVAVFNGTVREFPSDGIDLDNEGMVKCVRAIDNGDDGIDTEAGSIVTQCTAERNDDEGIRVQWGSSVFGCTARSNVFEGFYTPGGTVFQNCVVEFSGTNQVNQGALVTGIASVVINCTARYNIWDGIKGNFSNTIRNNTCTDNGVSGIATANACILEGNTCYGNGVYGIWVPANCRVVNNNCSSNTVVGIQVTDRFTVVRDNLICGNGTGIDTDQTRDYISRNKLSSNTVNEAIIGGSEASGNLANIEF